MTTNFILEHRVGSRFSRNVATGRKTETNTENNDAEGEEICKQSAFLFSTSIKVGNKGTEKKCIAFISLKKRTGKPVVVLADCKKIDVYKRQLVNLPYSSRNTEYLSYLTIKKHKVQSLSLIHI